MSRLPFAGPNAPDFAVDWPALDRDLPWVRAMRDCAQDPIHHAEGDVWTHVRMVCEALVGLPAWREAPEQDREILFAAALLHDVAKPACTREEEGRITSRGHSQRGAIDAREILWRHGTPFALREQICALVRHHQVPFHLIQREDAARLAFTVSQTARCDLLSILAQADALGRRCADQSEILVRVELFREFCREHGCLTGPRQFASARSRFDYFRIPGRDPAYTAHDDTTFEVILMSGLPGAGKDTWIARHASQLPVISLDALRLEHRDEGAVLQAAREQARVLLRQQQPFVWNATNLRRERRAPLVDLCNAYRARVRIVYVEVDQTTLLRQNRERERAVPVAVIERMLKGWEVPDSTEAQSVDYFSPTT